MTLFPALDELPFFKEDAGRLLLGVVRRESGIDLLTAGEL